MSIRYDCQYAANAVQGATQAQANRQLVEKCREIHVKVQARRAIDWTWVKGHAQVAGNEMAEKLADRNPQPQMGSAPQASTHKGKRGEMPRVWAPLPQRA